MLQISDNFVNLSYQTVPHRTPCGVAHLKVINQDRGDMMTCCTRLGAGHPSLPSGGITGHATVIRYVGEEQIAIHGLSAFCIPTLMTLMTLILLYD